jgi:hypothetical protein
MKMTEIQKMYLRARGRWSKNAGKEEEKKKAKQFAEIRDSERAGEFGTDKLTASYCASTPGQTNEAFEPHMMYDPKTGKGYKAEKEADHLRMKKLGYTHDEPDVKEGKASIKERGEDSKGHKIATEKGAGLTQKGVDAFRRKNPGSKLQTAVTGKVKPGSKDAKRRKSFCARMSGMKGPMKDDKGRPTRKAMSLKRWKC